MVAQLNDKGLFAVDEQREEFKSLLQKYSGTDVEIFIKPADIFSEALSESVRLQDIYNAHFKDDSPSYTIQQLVHLRGQIESVKMKINDLLADATFEKESKSFILDSIDRKEKISLIENGVKPQFASMKAKVSKEYEDAQKDLLQSIKIKEGLEAHCKSLAGASNAIAGIGKNGDDKYLKFGSR